MLTETFWLMFLTVRFFQDDDEFLVFEASLTFLDVIRRTRFYVLLSTLHREPQKRSVLGAVVC
jgi:hypothetical protein